MYYGDCLEVMRGWRDESVDLIYLDPPFNSKADYNVLFGKGKGEDKQDLAQMTAFIDTWQWDAAAAERVEKICKAIEHPAHYAIKSFDTLFGGEGNGILAYLSYMAERLAEMPRLLKSTGSIYLHCDPAASHYLKIIMDEVFGRANFRNEIIWCYTGPSASRRKFPGKHDTIYRYSKTDDFAFNADDVRVPYKNLNTQHAKAANTGIGGKLTPDTVDEYRRRGKIPEDWWHDISPVGRIQSERLGYPTQKPLALLKRIITASSNQGDIVLDPFCGCGTTIEAAHLLKRKWLGIDISTYALEVIRRERMKDMQIPLSGVPMDLASATSFARNNPFDFEKWAVTRIPGFAPNTVQRGDGGIDGRARIWGGEKENDLCIAQVKGGEAPSVDSVKAFAGMLIGGKAAIGVYITLRPLATPTVKKCIADAGKIAIGAKQYPRLVMYSIQEHFDNRPPNLPTFAHPRTGEAYQQDVTDLLA